MLPWTPKVRQKDIDMFLDYTRMKFIGFTVENDQTTMAGLPPSILEGVEILKKHLYKSLIDIQIEVRVDTLHRIHRGLGVSHAPFVAA